MGSPAAPRWRVLVSAPYMRRALDRFLPELEDHGVEVVQAMTSERLSEQELLELVPEIDGAICGDDRYTRRVLEAAPRLKVVSKWGTGIDSIDLEAAAELGVRVCNTPGAFTQPVSDTTLGYMLSFARKLPWMDRAMRGGRWEKIDGFALHERVLGVVGVGNIGKAVARRARAFGMRVLGTDIVPIEPEFLTETGVEMCALEELLRQADFVSLHCSLTPSSRQLIGREQLALMRPDTYLINVARGPVVVEAALVEALQEERIAGAALDVYENEPLPADSPLLNLETCLLAPHNANSSPAAWERTHRNTLDNLLAGLREVARGG